MQFQYTTLDRIFAKLEREGVDISSEADVIEWTGEALEFIGAVTLFEDAVAFIEVNNHQCALPRWLHSIIQIARNSLWSEGKEHFCPRNIASILELEEEKAYVPVAIDCEGKPENAYDVAYYRPYFDLQCDYFNWRNSPMYKKAFTPVRLTSHSFFDTLVCTTDDDRRGIYKSCVDEYKIISKSVLRFSFKTGQIALAYNRQQLDPKTGWPMVPDHISVTTAIVKYVTMMSAQRDYNRGREGAKGRLDDATQKWEWYCKQAGNAAMMPHGVDEHQNLLEQRGYLLPRQNRYYGFFGNLNKAENRNGY